MWHRGTDEGGWELGLHGVAEGVPIAEQDVGEEGRGRWLRGGL